MTIGTFYITFDFWSPWLFGYGKGWGSKWLDIGPLCIWWPDKTPRGKT